jgi:hypothetical protein
MNKEIIEEHIIELCYEKAQKEHPHLLIENLKINKINLLEDNIDVLYYFDLTSKRDPKVFMNIKKNDNFKLKYLIYYLRDRILTYLLQ